MVREAAVESHGEAVTYTKYKFKNLRDDTRRVATGTEVPEPKTASPTAARVASGDALELLHDHVIGTRGQARLAVPSQ